jgi:hypothetical protein
MPLGLAKTYNTKNIKQAKVINTKDKRGLIICVTKTLVGCGFTMPLQTLANQMFTF